MRSSGFESWRVALVAALVAALAGCFLGGGGWSSAAPSPAAAYALDPVALKRGRGLFVGTCGAYCHSLEPAHRDAPDLFDCTWLHGGSDREIFRTISNGVPNTRMVGFGSKLPEGDADIWKLIAFLRERSRCAS
ncbi:MAG: c-type cytochrome [Myxococcota bacterium]